MPVYFHYTYTIMWFSLLWCLFYVVHIILFMFIVFVIMFILLCYCLLWLFYLLLILCFVYYVCFIYFVWKQTNLVNVVTAGPVGLLLHRLGLRVELHNASSEISNFRHLLVVPPQADGGSCRSCSSCWRDSRCGRNCRHRSRAAPARSSRPEPHWWRSECPTRSLPDFLPREAGLIWKSTIQMNSNI